MYTQTQYVKKCIIGEHLRQAQMKTIRMTVLHGKAWVDP